MLCKSPYFKTTFTKLDPSSPYYSVGRSLLLKTRNKVIRNELVFRPHKISVYTVSECQKHLNTRPHLFFSYLTSLAASYRWAEMPSPVDFDLSQTVHKLHLFTTFPTVRSLHYPEAFVNCDQYLRCFYDYVVRSFRSRSFGWTRLSVVQRLLELSVVQMTSKTG